MLNSFQAGNTSVIGVQPPDYADFSGSKISFRFINSFSNHLLQIWIRKGNNPVLGIIEKI